MMRTLTSVEIEIMLILGLPCCLSSISVRCLENADGAQSSRVPIPFSEDPYEAIRQAYLDGTNTESEPFEDLVETETPESPLTVAPPTSLPESTLPTLVLILRRTARMVVRVPLEMSPGLSASMAEVAAMSESVFRKRFRPSYESLPSSSPPDLPLRKRYHGTSELAEDDEDEEDDDEEDEEIEESLDSDSVSEDAEDEGPTAEDEDPAAGDEGLVAGDKGPGMGVERHGLDDEGHSVESDRLGLGEEEEVVPKGQGSGSAPDLERPKRVSASRQPILTTWIDLGDGMVYIDVPAYPPPAPPVQTPPSPEWSSGLLPISPSPSIVPSPIPSPMIPLTVPSPVATPATVETEGFLTELGAQVEMQGGLIHDHAVRLEELSPALFERSLEHEQERVAVTFGALWRPVLALESWACQTDAQRATLWHAISDALGENQEL
ncbi:hypothetical protein Tco_0922357 [Tanacetum coccineum]|uniref:Uncharacterized protein n=1 Tax=Tanacetum coccineum TaxID=301880 RepID=A0ABQ5D0A1_9ASTR